MFVRKKKNRSESTSIVVVDKSNGRFRKLITIGKAKDTKGLVVQLPPFFHCLLYGSIVFSCAAKVHLSNSHCKSKVRRGKLTGTRQRLRKAVEHFEGWGWKC